MPRSMTSFAREEAQYSWGTLACEIRSVNHRYLEASVKLPESLRAIEPAIREKLRKTLSRGKVETVFFLRFDNKSNEELALNAELSQQMIALAESIYKQLDHAAPINPIDILKWPGVLTSAEVDSDTLKNAANDLLEATLKQLISSREREGNELKNFIEQRLIGIDEHVSFVRERMPQILEQHRLKLREKLDTLKVDVDEERFNQEAIYIAQKADVAEELDRLEAHIQEVKNTLNQKGPIGRRLDFLMQELNREANTLSSKSMASDTTQHAVDLKVLIEQMREQIQNIE